MIQTWQSLAGFVCSSNKSLYDGAKQKAAQPIMALRYQSLPSPLTFNHFNSFSTTSLLPRLHTYGTFTLQNFKLLSPFPLHPIPSLLPRSSIALPAPERDRAKKGDEEDEEESPEKEADEVKRQYPVHTFFKSSNPAKYPHHRKSNTTLHRSSSPRRTAWDLHLEFDSDEEETDPAIEFIGELGERGEIGQVVGQILEIARNSPDNSTLGERLREYEGRIGEAECIALLGLLSEEGLVRSCLDMYEWMRLQDPCLVTPRTCLMIFLALGKVGMGDKVMELWRSLAVDETLFRDVDVYNAALSGLLFSRRYDDAWKVYEDMEFKNIVMNHKTICIMIMIIRKEGGSAKETWEFFERMDKGLKWSSEVVGALIKSFCIEGLLKQALIILGVMEKNGTSSNSAIYKTLIDSFCKSNRLEEAEVLFIEMKAKGISPSSTTYNILMYAYSKRMQPEVVEKLLEEMRDANLEPIAKSYTCLISAYGRQKNNSVKAAEAFMRMKDAGIKPSVHSYTALIHAYTVSGCHEKACIAFEDMRREGIVPSIDTYTILLDAFRRAGDAKMLMVLWKSMRIDRIEGTQLTFNILVDGFAKQGQYMEAKEVVCEYRKIGIDPTILTYNMLMNAYARGGQHSMLPQLLKEMETLNIKPDPCTYSTMIYAYVRVDDFSRAVYYHKRMVKSGQLPDPRTYQKLRDALDVKDALKNKKDKEAIVGIVNSRFGRLKDKKKGQKDEFWKNKKKRRVSDRSAEVVQQS